MGFITSPDGGRRAPQLRPGVFIIPTRLLALSDPPWFVDGRRVVALAPHPNLEDHVFVTTEAPEALAFLPDLYVELD